MSPDESFAFRLLNKLSEVVTEELGLEDGPLDNDAPIVPMTHKTAAGTLEPAGFGIIRADDASFDTAAFYARVADTFLGVHAAMDAGNLDSVQHAMRANVFDELRGRACGGPAGELTITRCQALAIVRQGGQDHVRIRIVAKTASGDVVQEYWSFARDVGARSKADPSLFKCPNCGAPLDGDDRVRCGYCGVQLCDPALDWVVDKIAVDD